MENILIIDINSVIYKTAHALYSLEADGKPSGGVYGTLNTILLAIDRLKINHVLVAKDVKRSELERKKIYPMYKEHRKPMPDHIVEQSEAIMEFLNTLRISTYTYPGYEADDVIGSLVTSLKKDENNVLYILTSDKDLSQLVDTNVKIILNLNSRKMEIIDNEEKVIEKLGVKPHQIPDYFGLIGDSSDGIPGVLGVGKSIAKYVLEYDTIENIYKNLDNLPKRLVTKLKDNIKIAKLSRDLATINTNLALKINLNGFQDIDVDTFTKLCDNWKLNTLKNKFLKLYNNNKTIEKIKTKAIEKYKLVDNIDEILKENLIYLCLENDNFSLLANDKIYLHLQSKNLFSLDSIQLEDLNDLLKDKKVIVYSYKSCLHNGISLNDFEDVSIINHLVSKDKSKDLEESYTLISDNDIYKPPKSKKEFNEEEHIKNTLKYNLLYLETVYENGIKKLENEENLMKLYNEIEKKLIFVLYDMEKTGILVDVEYFNNLKLEFNEKILELEKKIYAKANKTFNINSPKELSHVLFVDLQIPPVKKTKDSFSSDSFVLETLSKIGYDIANDLLEYRKYTKLLNTYIEVFLKKVDDNNRLHTTFSQIGTTTGRLSSENPNLQTIPSRTEEGYMIRKGLISKEGYTLLSCDYSQIELRILAYLSKDENLINAYKNNKDLHENTARKLFSIPNDKPVTKEQRNVAKVINFSVLYGKTSFGLSQELSISIQQASKYINDYFDEYKGVKEYIKELIEKTEKLGYVETLFKTRRYIDGLSSSNKFIREAYKRMTVNTAIQGTASNVLKKVMIILYNNISKYGKMLLQVHDELVFEIKTEFLEQAITEIVDIMENTIKLTEVNLKVNYQTGKNWSYLK